MANRGVLTASLLRRASSLPRVIPAKAGTSVSLRGFWKTEVPAFAGMTLWLSFQSGDGQSFSKHRGQRFSI
jgi:hypothetical protein